MNTTKSKPSVQRRQYSRLVMMACRRFGYDTSHWPSHLYANMTTYLEYLIDSGIFSGQYIKCDYEPTTGSVGSFQFLYWDDGNFCPIDPSMPDWHYYD